MTTEVRVTVPSQHSGRVAVTQRPIGPDGHPVENGQIQTFYLEPGDERSFFAHSGNLLEVRET